MKPTKLITRTTHSNLIEKRDELVNKFPDSKWSNDFVETPEKIYVLKLVPVEVDLNVVTGYDEVDLTDVQQKLYKIMERCEILSKGKDVAPEIENLIPYRDDRGSDDINIKDDEKTPEDPNSEEEISEKFKN